MLTITVEEDEEDEEEEAAAGCGGGGPPPPPPPKTFAMPPSRPSPLAMSHSGVPGNRQGSAPSLTASTCFPMAAPASRPRMRSLRPLGLGEVREAEEREGEEVVDAVGIAIVAETAVAGATAATAAAAELPPLALKTAA